MNPTQKIMATILHECMQSENFPCEEVGEITEENVEELYSEFCDFTHDVAYEFREGDFPTPGICKDHSRHYETTGVAAKMFDGSYVGWTYWFGGGKHGEPESEPWMENAYELNCVEEEKLMIVRTFTEKK